MRRDIVGGEWGMLNFLPHLSTHESFEIIGAGCMFLLKVAFKLTGFSILAAFIVAWILITFVFKGRLPWAISRHF
jgi:hypothetical protein